MSEPGFNEWFGAESTAPGEPVWPTGDTESQSANEPIIALGVFDHMLHSVEPGADTEVLQGLRYWWPACREMCVLPPAPVDLRSTAVPLCHKCFPATSAGKG